MSASTHGALVFITSSGAPLRSSNVRQRIWLPATEACGLPGLRVHDLRHTAASLAVKSGANPKVVQQMLGHASAMTLDVYAGRSTQTSINRRAASRAADVSRVCPQNGPDGGDETEGNRGDDGLGGVPALVS